MSRQMNATSRVDFPRSSFADYHAARVTAVDDAISDAMRLLGEERVGRSRRLAAMTRRKLLASKASELFDYRAAIRSDGSFDSSCLGNRSATALMDRFGYEDSKVSVPRTLSDAAGTVENDFVVGLRPAQETVRGGNYMRWRNAVMRHKFNELKRGKVAEEVNEQIQLSLRKAQAAEAAEWALYNNPDAFLTLEDKLANYQTAMRRMLKPHTQAITVLRWSHIPAPNMLAAASEDCTVTLSDAMNNRVFAKMTGHSKTVTDIDWHASNAYLASVSLDKTVRIWRVDAPSMAGVSEGDTSSASEVEETGARAVQSTCVRIIYGTTPVLGIRFAPMNPSLLAVITYTPEPQGLLKIFHLDTGRLVQTVKLVAVPVAMEFSTSGSALFISDVQGCIRGYSFSLDIRQQMSEPFGKNGKLLLGASVGNAVKVGGFHVPGLAISPRSSFSSQSTKRASEMDIDFASDAPWLVQQLSAVRPPNPVALSMSYRANDVELRAPSLTIRDTNESVRLLHLKMTKKVFPSFRTARNDREEFTEELAPVDYFTMGAAQLHRSVVSSRRSEFILAGCADGALYVYNPYANRKDTTGDERQQCFSRLIAHTTQVVAVAWNADESLLGSADAVGHVALWMPRSLGPGRRGAESYDSFIRGVGSAESTTSRGSSSSLGRSISVTDIPGQAFREVAKTSATSLASGDEAGSHRVQAGTGSRCPMCNALIATDDIVTHMDIHSSS